MSNWVKGSPAVGGVFVVRYSRAKSKEQHVGIARRRSIDSESTVIIGSRGVVLPSYDRRDDLWYLPKIHSHRKVG